MLLLVFWNIYVVPLARSIASTAIGYVVPISTLIGCVTYSYKRLVSDIGNRSSGETKVPVEEIPMMNAKGQTNKLVQCVEYVRGEW